MLPGRASRTALGAAFHRAAHQVLEGGSVFAAPLALRILGVDAAGAVRPGAVDPATRRLRLFIAVRARFAEDALAAAAARGVTQLVVLGAGLDTFAYRSPLGATLRVFEVDHPDTQAWKRRLLAEAGIPSPPGLVFVPIDFERETLAGALGASGFDPLRAAFFTWLGVVPYLSAQAVFATLGFMAGLPGGAQVVFDYANPGPEDNGLAERVAAAGEAIRSRFDSGELHARMTDLGFNDIEDLGPAQIRERYFPGRGGPAPATGGHVLRAAAPRGHS